LAKSLIDPNIRRCKFTDKAFQPSEQVEERDYLTCLPLWLRYRL